jgi:hypothetical protein
MEEPSMNRSTTVKCTRAIQAFLIVMTFALFAPSLAAADNDDVTHPTMCGQKVSGNVVLTQDIICVDAGAGANGLTVVGPNTTISFHGFSIKCSGGGYKFSCQGLAFPSDYSDTSIETCGFSNVNIKGPGMIQGFSIGVRMRGIPPPDATGPCGAGATTPNANNVKTQKLNVTGPDGRQDISDPVAGPRPASFGIDVTDFVENASTCSHWDSDDGHTHGVEVFGNAVDNHTEGIALYNSSRVDVHENFAHDNNNAGDATTGSVVTDTTTTTTITGGTTTIGATYESHGIVVCGVGQPLCHGTSLRNHIHNNLIVNNGQNAHANTAGSDSSNSTLNNDGGLTLTGDARKNLVHENTVIGNDGDGISIRNTAQLNKIIDNSSAYNTSTDSAGGYEDPILNNCLPGMPIGTPCMPYFWDVAFRNAGSSNTIQNNNRCLTESPSATTVAPVCGPNENTTWFQTP